MMKRAFNNILIMLALVVAGGLPAATTVPVMLGWQYFDTAAVKGYRIYWGTVSGVYRAATDVGFVSRTPDNVGKVALPWDGRSPLYVNVTAIGLNGEESDFANEVQVR